MLFFSTPSTHPTCKKKAEEDRKGKKTSRERRERRKERREIPGGRLIEKRTGEVELSKKCVKFSFKDIFLHRKKRRKEAFLEVS